MANKKPFPFQKPGAKDDGAKRRGGKLPGLDKLPKGDNPKDSPAKEMAERLKGIKT